MQPSLSSPTERIELETDDLEALLDRFGPNVDRYFQTNILCAQVLRMTARPAVKSDTGKKQKATKRKVVKKQPIKKAIKKKGTKKTGK